MQKTKLGISVGLFGAAIYFSGLFSGYFVLILLAGYALLFEDNEWLRRTAVKAVTLLISFSLLAALIGLIPSSIDILNRLLLIFSNSFSLSLSILTKIISLITGVVDLLKVLLFILLGLKAFNQGTLPIPVVDTIIGKYMN